MRLVDYIRTGIQWNEIWYFFFKKNKNKKVWYIYIYIFNLKENKYIG